MKIKSPSDKLSETAMQNRPNTQLDIVIPIKTDILPLAIKHTIPSVRAKLPYKNIYAITKRNNFSVLKSYFGDNLKLLDEDEICNGLSIGLIEDYFRKRNEIPERAGWYFQQFLKLGIAQLDIISDSYLIWDADAVVLRPITFFSEDGKIYITKAKGHNEPYFKNIEKLIGIKKQVNYSFIAEHFVLSKEIVLSILGKIAAIKNGHWWLTVLESVDNLSGSGFSEYELYGNYAIKHYPDRFQARNLYTIRGGTLLLGMNPDASRLRSLSSVIDYISFERWHRDYRFFPLRRTRLIGKIWAMKVKKTLKRFVLNG